MIKSHPYNNHNLFCSWRDFDNYVSSIFNQLQSSKWIPDYIVGVKRGGLIPAVKLSHMLDKPLIMMSCQLRDDADNRVKLLEAESLSKDKKILIIDDICDSGNTLQKIIEETLKDNRELKSTQESLKASNKELSAKNRELEQFAYIASHDLQEPLRKIRNFTSLAERNLTQEDKEKLYFPKINAAAERMSRLIKDVLNYSRLTVETDMFVLVDLNEVLNEVINDFEFLIREKQAKIETENLPVIKGIPVQISQLFYNIIGNSLKFVNIQPSIKIASEIVDVSNKEVAGTYHKISISDNGIGIEQQHIDKLFIIFKRLHPQNVYEGTGIGLALCKKIAQNHGGFMEIESEPGQGTKVSGYIPVHY
jgi:light-regulated signal transduction histidine kinase (bacteriophytochrome)